MKLILDFESRSRVNLKTHGVYVYAADPSTEILCCAVKVDDQPPWIWFPKLDGNRDAWAAALPLIREDYFQQLVDGADVLEAHNAQFERVMWHHIMHKRLGHPDPALNKWRCTAAQAAAHALPRHLDGVGAALGLPLQKDGEGHKLMLKMSKPDKKGNWIEDTASLIRLARYCITDVEVEHAVSKAVPELPESEQRIWQLDQEINDRGIALDAAGARAIKAHVAEAEKTLLFEVDLLTNGALSSTNQRDKMIAWLEAEGVEVDDLKKGSVIDALDGMDESKAKRLLEIRQSLSLASVKKIDAMLRLASTDNRIRGAFLYYGATTGRWSGKGIQPQNYPRDSYKKPEQVDDVIAGKFDGPVMKAASRSLRGLLVPGPGNVFTAVDYSAIEARVLAWLADEQSALDVFRNKLDPYIVVASQLFGVPYGQVTKEQRQQGKIPELACGYQGWIGAYHKFAVVYQVEIPPDERVAEIILDWRANRPRTVDLWGGFEEAAFEAVRTGGTYQYSRVKFGVRDRYLYMRLPSGRMLAYPDPAIETRVITYPATETKEARRVRKEVVTFMGVNNYTRRWERESTYGGKLTENAVQAISRDIQAEGLLNVDMCGVPIVMHAHDEIVAEMLHGVCHHVEKIMSHLPTWADGLPLAAEGWEGTRYRK